MPGIVAAMSPRARVSLLVAAAAAAAAGVTIAATALTRTDLPAETRGDAAAAASRRSCSTSACAPIRRRARFAGRPRSTSATAVRGRGGSSSATARSRPRWGRRSRRGRTASIELQELGRDHPESGAAQLALGLGAVLARPDGRRGALVAARRGRGARLDVRGARRRLPPSRASRARLADVRAVVCLARAAASAEPARAVRVPAPTCGRRAPSATSCSSAPPCSGSAGRSRPAASSSARPRWRRTIPRRSRRWRSATSTRIGPRRRSRGSGRSHSAFRGRRPCASISACCSSGWGRSTTRDGNSDSLETPSRDRYPRSRRLSFCGGSRRRRVVRHACRVRLQRSQQPSGHLRRATRRPSSTIRRRSPRSAMRSPHTATTS